MNFDSTDDRYNENFNEQWREMGTDSREEAAREDRPLLFELYDDVYEDVKAQGVPVDWVDDDLDMLVVGNWEVQEVKYDYKGIRMRALEMKPHSGEFKTDKFKLYESDATMAGAFLKSHADAFKSLVEVSK